MFILFSISAIFEIEKFPPVKDQSAENLKKQSLTLQFRNVQLCNYEHRQKTTIVQNRLF